MKRRAVRTFFVAAAMGGLVWALSPALTGHLEPWDASGPYYVSALAIAGAISGGLIPKSLWAHYLGAVFGQAFYGLVFLHIGPLFILGVVFLLSFSVIFLAAAALAALIRTRYARRPNTA